MIEQYENLMWIGKSKAVVEMRQALLGVADAKLPVLLCGRTGTGKVIAAYAIHLQMQAQGESHPFIVSCCKHWPANSAVSVMDKLCEQASGGTLFLRDVNALGLADTCLIKEYWLSESVKAKNVRIVASTSDIPYASNQRFHVDSSFTNWLYYHCLTVELKSLAERVDDIEALLDFFAKDQQNTQVPPVVNRLTDDAVELLKAYDWPGNVKQLQRCLEKLAVLCADQQINKECLLCHFPAMAACELNEGVVQLQSIEMLNDSQPQVSLVNICSDEFHPALNRAIDFICKHYRQSICMTELASHACVSPSHLSSLFKRHLGQSFKQVLLKLRIDEAVKLFGNNPNRMVTHICDDVGFSDLSFFERKFKQQVGVSPGVYRDQFVKSSK